MRQEISNINYERNYNKICQKFFGEVNEKGKRKVEIKKGIDSTVEVIDNILKDLKMNGEYKQ